MGGIPSETWFPVITLILGAALTALFELAKDRRADRRDREARRDSRNDAIRLRRVDFQRSTLLELQEAVSQFVRFTGRIHLEDASAFRESGQWRKALLTEEVDEGFRKSTVQTLQLRVRVRDDLTRQIAGQLSDLCVKVILARSEQESEGNMRLVADTAKQLHERIGIVLRSLDDDEDQVVDTTRN